MRPGRRVRSARRVRCHRPGRGEQRRADRHRLPAHCRRQALRHHPALVRRSHDRDRPERRAGGHPIFLMKIGGKLSSGEKHDGRAPDYDDWDLNGDIIFNYPLLGIGLELSSMGIRVDENSLEEQLKIANCEDRRSLPYHQMILNKVLPYTIGGGIGQSRICMFFLDKLHIGEVQASIWSQEVHEICRQMNIKLL